MYTIHMYLELKILKLLKQQLLKKYDINNFNYINIIILVTNLVFMVITILKKNKKNITKKREAFCICIHLLIIKLKDILQT